MCRLGSYPCALYTSYLIHHPAERYLLSRSARANTLRLLTGENVRLQPSARNVIEVERVSIPGRPRTGTHSCQCPVQPVPDNANTRWPRHQNFSITPARDPSTVLRER